jgi:poly(ribitol-phosphate) beta-N-acetylglucosaminyltransferase
LTKVSVVVPVYNPGRYIEPLIESLLGQTLPDSEYELIFVDDGSTDETPARLDELAAAHANVRVKHTENSGWSGRPRNIGIDMARGEFVFFADNDDYLGVEALERLYDRAVSLDADIVIGKTVGHGRQRVPRAIFSRNRDDVTLEWRPLLHLLSPHKLFRRSFLLEHGFRFPEGKRRLEDHHFVVHAYFHARRIAILADYPCYHWVGRDPGESASRTPWDPVVYYQSLRDVLDIVDEHTEPGEFRDHLKGHWHRGKILKRLGPPKFHSVPDDYRAVLYREIRAIETERFGPESLSHIPFNMRVRSHLLRADQPDALLALSCFERDLRSDVIVRGVRQDGAVLELDLEATLRGEKDPFVFARRGERIVWHPPSSLGISLPDEALDATEFAHKPTLHLVLKSPVDGTEFMLHAKVEPALEPVGGGRNGDGEILRVVARSTVRIDPAKAAAGSPLRGEWQGRAEYNVAGYRAPTRIRRPRFGGRLTVVVRDGVAVAEWERSARAALARRVVDRVLRRKPEQMI